MLQPAFRANDVVTIKLVTGEEIVTRLGEPESTSFTISRPLVFTVNPQSGQAMLIPWLMSVEAKDPTPIVLYKTSIVSMTKPVKQIADHYTQATSGIVAAPAGLVI